jgi:soluble lytic murein transglycosylase-like protein
MWRFFAALLLLSLLAPAEGPVPVESAKPTATKMTAVERQLMSVERQRAAIQQNYPAPFAGMGQNMASAPPVTPPADCPAMTPADVKPIITREAEKHKLDTRLVQAVVETESAYSPCAVSSAGAMGLMQLMPATAESLQVTDPFDPNQNITAGTAFLKQMLERYGGDVAKALAAYNAGPARVDAAGGIPAIPETQEYVRKIMGKITAPRPVE